MWTVSDRIPLRECLEICWIINSREIPTLWYFFTGNTFRRFTRYFDTKGVCWLKNWNRILYWCGYIRRVVPMIYSSMRTFYRWFPHRCRGRRTKLAVMLSRKRILLGQLWRRIEMFSLADRASQLTRRTSTTICLLLGSTTAYRTKYSKI